MKILWLFLIVHTVGVWAFGQPGFGRSYLRNSKLCHQWSCVNTHLGLQDTLPTFEEFGEILRERLPEEWHGVVDNVLRTCYGERPRRYSNTCPGQAILHCAVDQLIENCPEQHLRKKDACAPINSIAGFNIMFTQSRYEDLESHMEHERRPAWFLKNYFSSKCCNLPDIIEPSVLTTCKFNTMIEYYGHSPQVKDETLLRYNAQRHVPAASNNVNSLQVVTLNPPPANSDITDPLECCDISAFIQPSWRHECSFDLHWEGQRRLVINRDTDVITTSTQAPPSVNRPVRRDLTVVPQSCEKEACVFTKLDIITSDGTIDLNAFTKLLDNLTNSQPSWTSAKGRVLTTCLKKPITEYDEKCEINNLLACTFDVLTENCPNATKDDLCKHTKTDRICQISTSKHRPKNRRNTCILPELVNRNVLSECGLSSLSKVKLAQTPNQPKKYIFTRYKCQDLTPSTTCVLSKMGVLNKYGFTDYFKMKDHIRQFAQNEWSQLVNVYLDSFTSGPLYREHCNSPKKFLNVIESMLLTCPLSKRKDTEQCRNIFNQLSNTPVANSSVTTEQVDQILKHFHNVFFPQPAKQPSHFIRPKYTSKLVQKPIYNYGILSDKYAPKVEIIDVKPNVVESPLVLLPVYMRLPNSNLSVRPIKEVGIMRSSFWLHNRIAQANNVSFNTEPEIQT